MNISHILLLPSSLFAALFFFNYCTGVFLPNLSEACYKCLCYVSTRCDLSHECTKGYCGPYNISRVYWVDAGMVTLPDDDPERNHDYNKACHSLMPERIWDTLEQQRIPQPYINIISHSVVRRICQYSRGNAWEDCARSFHCAKRIIEGYLEKFGRDCNNDGVTDCYDYMMINGNGGYGCTAPLNRSANGQRWLRRYEECRQSLKETVAH